MANRFGLSAALTTPYRLDGRIDLAKMVAHARNCLAIRFTVRAAHGLERRQVAIGRADAGHCAICSHVCICWQHPCRHFCPLARPASGPFGSTPPWTLVLLWQAASKPPQLQSPPRPHLQHLPQLPICRPAAPRARRPNHPRRPSATRAALPRTPLPSVLACRCLAAAW